MKARSAKLLLPLLLAACGARRDAPTGTGAGGGADTGGADAGTPGSDAGAPDADGGAALPPQPQVLDEGGPVIASPRFVPVFFANDDAPTTAQIASFVAGLGSSAYWSAATAEYGVAAATAAPPVQLAEAAPSTLAEADVQAWLAGKLEAADPALPAADGATIYVVFYPSGTTFTSLEGNTSCVDFGAIHRSVTLDAAHASLAVPYALVGRCPSFDGESAVDAVTLEASHELVEASTDPLLTAWARVDGDHYVWSIMNEGSEVADMCNIYDPITPAGFPFVVERVWSNAAARAGHDPCVPAPAGKAYFGATPALPDTVTLQVLTGTTVTPVQARAVVLAVGQTKTIDVSLFADAPLASPFLVQAFDYDANDGQAAALTLSMDKGSGQGGDTRQLTITLTRADPSGYELFYVGAFADAQDPGYWQYGLVVNQ